MIGLPENIKSIMEAFEGEGHACFVVGGAVRDMMAGDEPWDWDLAVDADLAEMVRIFPGAEVINHELSVIRIKPAEGETGLLPGFHADVARLREEKYEKGVYGTPSEVVFTKEIEKDLKRRDFTVNAMAFSGRTGLVDIYEGKEDIAVKTLRTVGDPFVRLEEDPSRILRAVRMVSERGYRADGRLRNAMTDKSGLLAYVSKDRIREEFIRIAAGQYVRSAVELMASADMMQWLTGEKEAPELKASLFDTSYYDNGNDTERQMMRLCSFYRGYPPGKGIAAIEYLRFDKKTEKTLKNAVTIADTLLEMTKKPELKEFLALYGFEYHAFMEKIIAGESGGERRIVEAGRRRLEMAEEIRRKKEPLTVKDLDIDGDDIKKLGARGRLIGRILDMLAEQVRKEPEQNSRKRLEVIAREYVRTFKCDKDESKH